MRQVLRLYHFQNQLRHVEGVPKRAPLVADALELFLEQDDVVRAELERVFGGRASRDISPACGEKPATERFTRQSQKTEQETINKK